MKLKRFVCITVGFLGFGLLGFSQKTDNSYQSSVGIRLGSEFYSIFSASLKSFLGDSPGAIELNLGFKPESYGYYGGYSANVFNLSFSAAYQYHFDIAPLPGLRWFIGGGLTAYNSFVSKSASEYYGSGIGFGLFPTGGLDYKFERIPLNLSIDSRPTFELVRPNDFHPYFIFGLGASARYAFR